MEDVNKENMLLKITIFIVLNITLTLLALALISRIATGAGFYERVYAKNIALLIDESAPGTEIFLDISKGAEIAGKEKFTPEISIQKNKVIVKLFPGPGSYDTFFKSLDIKAEYLPNNQIIHLIISDKPANENQLT